MGTQRRRQREGRVWWPQFSPSPETAWLGQQQQHLSSLCHQHSYGRAGYCPRPAQTPGGLWGFDPPYVRRSRPQTPLGRWMDAETRYVTEVAASTASQTDLAGVSFLKVLAAGVSWLRDNLSFPLKDNDTEIVSFLRSQLWWGKLGNFSKYMLKKSTKEMSLERRWKYVTWKDKKTKSHDVLLTWAPGITQHPAPPCAQGSSHPSYLTSSQHRSQLMPDQPASWCCAPREKDYRDGRKTQDEPWNTLLTQHKVGAWPSSRSRAVNSLLFLAPG